MSPFCPITISVRHKMSFTQYLRSGWIIFTSRRVKHTNTRFQQKITRGNTIQFGNYTTNLLRLSKRDIIQLQKFLTYCLQRWWTLTPDERCLPIIYMYISYCIYMEVETVYYIYSPYFRILTLRIATLYILDSTNLCNYRILRSYSGKNLRI